MAGARNRIPSPPVPLNLASYPGCVRSRKVVVAPEAECVIGDWSLSVPMTSPTHTISLHRVLRSPAERIYRAFITPDALVKWLPPHGFTARVHQFEARVGGRFRMSFTHFAGGKEHAFGGEYVELVPHERLRYTDRFEDPNLPGVIQVTVLLRPVSCGTELTITQEGVPAVIPAEACYLGWQESLNLLAQLVEPEIPG